ncbi:MAG: PAS domain S-box protein [Desulfomonile tiedjei]|nr:PAS domain S-box protein [Desulfomonile tiedjei]
MDDENKTREQLIREIQELRDRLSAARSTGEEPAVSASAPNHFGFAESPTPEPADNGTPSLKPFPSGDTFTESIDLSSLFSKDLTASGSFDVRSEIWATTFGKVMRALPIPALLVDEASTISVANEAWGRVNRDYRGIFGSTFASLFSSPAAGPKAEAVLDMVFADRKPRVAEARLSVGDNGMWGRLTFRSIRIFNERFVLVLVEDLTREKTQLLVNRKQRDVLQREIAERKAAEKALRESEQFLSNIFTSIQDGITVQDTELNIVRANPSVERRFAHAMPVVGKKCYEAFHGRSLPCETCPTQRAIKTGQPAHQVVSDESPGRDGLCWAELHAFPMFDPATGKLTGVIEYAVDITERKRAEDELKALEKRSRLLIEESPIGIAILQQGKVVYVNPAVMRIFGLESAEAYIGTPVEQFVIPAERETVRERYADRMAGKPVSLYYEATGLKPNGENIDIAVWPRLTAYQGEPAILVFTADITESKAMRGQLLHAQKMEAIGTLAAGIAHEFNNLLTVASGYTELLMAGKREGDRDYADLQKIAASCTRGAELVTKLRLLARKAEYAFRTLDLNRELNETVELLSPRLPANVAIDLRLDASLRQIRADSSQVAQLVVNLMMNAVDAMSEGGQLTIETKNCTLDEEYCRAHLGAKAGDYVQLTVTDTGHGMDDETASRVFEPFFTTRGLANRSGLGLAMVHGIVEQHGGHIACESKVGSGTTFRIYLPATSEPERIERVREKVAIQGGTETVLVVEDEELVRNLLTEMLRRVGYGVLAATNGREALTVYDEERGRISLVVLDLIMPQMGGRECLGHLLQRNPQLKVIIATGYSDEANRDQLIEAGARGFVSKPLEMAQFLRTVREALDRD